MASKYYGQRGSRVRAYQRYLNTLGANLAVDGIWGEKTETAYAKNKEAFDDKLRRLTEPAGEAGAQPPAQVDPEPTQPDTAPTPQEDPYTYMDWAIRDEEQLRSAAEGTVGAQYDTRLSETQAASADRQASIEEELRGLDAEYQSAVSALEERYRKQRQTISDAALSRGLGRSSYVTDQLAGSAARETGDANAAWAERTARETELGQQLLNDRAAAARATANTLNERESAILAAIESMRGQDQSAANAAISYNNSLLRARQESAAQADQFDKEMARKQKEWEEKMRLEYQKLARK